MAGNDTWTMTTAQWFDDWREWIEWISSGDDLGALERRKLAEGRQRLSLIDMMLHAGELTSRAVARAEFISKVCSQFVIAPEGSASALSLAQRGWVQLPDSGVWGTVRGMYIRRRAFDLLKQIMEEEARAPLIYRTGVDCPECGAHYPGGTSQDANLPCASDICLAPELQTRGGMEYRCALCGVHFVMRRGRQLTCGEATRRSEQESDELAAALTGRPLWVHRVLSWVGRRLTLR